MKRVFAPLATTLSLALTISSTVLPAAYAQTGQSASSALQRVESDPVSGITEYRLKSNNLQVLLAERPSTPIVTVMVVYHVGSRNEAVGYTGSTHFLEHLMFRGTKDHDPKKGTGIDDVLKPIGGINNATTFYDRTNYYEMVPAQYLGTCLELEADRMRNALIRQDDRDSEMTVVRNELERNEDDPGRLLDWNLFAHSFLAHPYHHPVIGWRSDVENVPLARLRKFYNDFYYPNNATLVVIGDFKSANALELINKYFSKVPASPAPFPKVYTTEPPQEGTRRFSVQRGTDLPKVIMGFHAPNATNKDTYPLEVAASILGSDSKQSSRLYKALVDKNLASDCYAYNAGLKDPALFNAFATATPGTPSEKVEAVLLDQLEKLATEPPSEEELDKAKKSVWKRMKLEAADPMGMASQLAEAIAVADWKWWVNLENNIKAVTKEDVQRVARKYFVKRNETVGYYYPIVEATKASVSAGSPKTADQPSSPGPAVTPATTPNTPAVKSDAPAVSPTASPTAPPVDVQPEPTKPLAPSAEPQKPAGYRHGGKLVSGTSGAMSKSGVLIAAASAAKPGATAKASEPLIMPKVSIASQVQKRVLPNGLTLLVMPVKGSGVVAVAGKMRAGDYFHPKGVYSVPDLMAGMLDKGSDHWTKDALAQQLEVMGTSLDFSAGRFWMDFESEIVKEDLTTYLSMVSDVVQHPLFPQEELEKDKKQRAAAIQAAMADNEQVASNAFFSSVYKPDCVYYRQPYPAQLEETTKIAVEQLKDFHKSYVTPANTIIAIVGDIDPAETFAAAEKQFGGWTGAPGTAKIEVNDCTDPAIAARTITNTMADKANVEVMMGTPAALSITSKDFFAASLANAALGHDTLSSRLAELRNKHGFTYGISSFFSENAFENGPWLIDFTVNPENLNKALPVVQKIVADYVKSGISKQELDEESKRLIGEYIIERMRTPRHLADAISKYEILGLGAKFMDEYPANIRAVTQAQANEAIRKYFQMGKMVTSVAGTVPPGAKK